MREYLLVFLVAAAATYLLTVVAREIALRTGAVAAVRDRDVHAEPTPYLGGLAMLGGLVAAYVVARQLPFLSTHGGPFVFHDTRNVLIAGAMICAVGTLDDLFELDALTKLGGQVLAAGFLILNGIQYILFPKPDGGQLSLDSAQGALLTAFELRNHGIPHTLIADNAGGLLMARGQVDAVIVGTDRVTANGDVCNNIGTYLKALAAHDTGVPFYVALPHTTFDAATPSGDAIPIEERSPAELTEISGATADGLGTVRLTQSDAYNPAFDVTPARLVTGYITERGVLDRLQTPF